MKKLTLIGLLFASPYLFAESAATVLSTSNSVTGMHNGASRSISRGTTLDAGDSIITGDGGLASIKYTNGTLVNLGANTNYKILDYSPKPGAVQIKSELKEGAMNTQTNGKTKEAVKTPVIALAVLGTKFELAVRCVRKSVFKRKKYCENTVNLHVIEGTVEAGGKILNAGSSIVATSGGGVRPAPFPASGQVNPPASSPPTTGSGAVTLTVTNSTNSSVTTTTNNTSNPSATTAPVISLCPPSCGP